MRLEEFVEVGGILRSGVYALVSKGVVIYIGKSRAMLARIYTHRQNWINKRKGKIPEWLSPVKGMLFDEIHIRPCMLESLDELEREMIDKYKPRYNEQLKTQEKIVAPIALIIQGHTLRLNEEPIRIIRRF